MIMEGIAQQVTPVFKCMVLLLLVFTAKVLTSRPQESENSKNSIQQNKPHHYVRTFTKYHHIRTHEWPVTEHKIIKRNVDQSKELIDIDIPNLNFATEKQKKVISKEVSGKNGVSNDMKKYKVKAAIMVTDPPKVKRPGISCLYKIHSVAFSVTPSYDENDDQPVVENDNFDTPGNITETTLPSGETVEVEQCTEQRASCYILWHQDHYGNTTVLGQGCWRSSAGAACDKCTRVTPRLPGTKFCCCTKAYCNADFLSIKEEIITPKAESTIDSKSQSINYSNIAAATVLAAIAILVMAVAVRRIYCQRRESESETMDKEKGEVMENGPDGLATGLTCVDNLTLIEHIGQGKFGSVWRGLLGSRPVAVKLYSSAAAWQREVAVYTLPAVTHRNILHYLGSDTRPNLTSGCGRSRLIVLELCAESLRQRLSRAPLPPAAAAHVAHGLSAAVAHLHSTSPTKPCIVHRDINSNNVLLTHDGDARLADLGLTQVRRDDGDTRIAEAGTLRYLSPEALEGALDLCGARAALAAVDVYAMGLVLWEILWRASGREAALPFQHAGLPPRHTAAMMQNLVCRNKVRPPLPTAGTEPRVLRVLRATCEECWDHDAEARLTAVCVEERMAELKQILQAPQPVIHDNNLHPGPPAEPTAPETDKNSNCLQNVCDVRTPLLYTHPHTGRNPCAERNTHTHTQTDAPLVHKSLKDITLTNEPGPRVVNQEPCLSVARDNPNRRPIIETERNHERSYQRPLGYVPNDVSAHEEIKRLKDTNLHQDVKVEKPKWGIKKFFEKYKTKDTEVKLVQDSVMKTSVVKDNNFRPSDLVLNKRLYNFEPPCLSPPNRTLSPTMMLESDLNRDNRVFGYKEIPNEEDKQIFAVIVPKAKPDRRGSSDSLNKSAKNSMSSQSLYKMTGNSESEDSTIKKRLSTDNRIITNSGRSSRASINLELQYLEQNSSPFDLNSDCSSSEDEHLMLLSENGLKITMQTIPKEKDILKESAQPKPDFSFNKYHNKYANFDNEFSDPNDKENLSNYTVENPVYIAAFDELQQESEIKPKNLSIKRQHSLEQVGEIFSSSSDVHLQNPAGRVKTPGDLPIAIRKARRDRALQKGRANETNRLSLYDDRMMFGNSL